MILKFTHILRAALALAAMAALADCANVENRTPPAAVWIPFATEHDWRDYGRVVGALDHRDFIKPEGLPKDFPYTAVMQTGYGGVLLLCDVNSEPRAFDLSCPVENRSDVRVKIDPDTHEAYCPKCGSRYSVFSNGGIALSGPAQKDNYHLTRYSVSSINGGPNGEYRVVSR